MLEKKKNIPVMASFDRRTRNWFYKWTKCLPGWSLRLLPFLQRLRLFRRCIAPQRTRRHLPSLCVYSADHPFKKPQPTSELRFLCQHGLLWHSDVCVRVEVTPFEPELYSKKSVLTLPSRVCCIAVNLPHKRVGCYLYCTSPAAIVLSRPALPFGRQR